MEAKSDQNYIITFFVLQEHKISNVPVIREVQKSFFYIGLWNKESEQIEKLKRAENEKLFLT